MLKVVQEESAFILIEYLALCSFLQGVSIACYADVLS